MAARHVPELDDFGGPDSRSIDLREGWLVLRRRWLPLLLLTVLGALGGAGYAYSTSPTYQATSQVLVEPVTQGPLNLPAQVSTLVNMSTEQTIAQSGPVVDQAASLLHAKQSVISAEAAKHLTVAVPTTSDVLQLTWAAASPKAASRGANAFAQSYLLYRHNYLAGTIAVLNTTLTHQVTNLQHQIASVYARLNNGGSQATRQSLNTNLAQLNSQLSTANDQLASLPTYDDTGGKVILSSPPLTPSGLGRKVLLAIGLVIGLMLGVVVAFCRDAFDDRIRDSAQLEHKLGAPTLAVLLPAGRSKPGRDAGQARPAPDLSIVTNPNGRSAEAVRALRATLMAVAAHRNLKTVLIVGADATVSSSQMAAELGVALTEVGRRVLLMGADMRGSSLAQIFDIPNSTGLGDLLLSGGDAEVIIRRPRQVHGVALRRASFNRLAVLPSGSQPTALSVVDSSAMVDLVDSQREAFEFVLLDSPPASVASEVIALATHVDGVLVIAREASTRGRATADLRRRLDQVGAEVIGGVLVGKARAGQHRSASARPAAAAVAAPEPRARETAADQLSQTTVMVVPDGLESQTPGPDSVARRSG